MRKTMTKDDLIAIGYKPHTAVSLIRQAKEIMVKKGYPFYNNKRLGRVPRDVVESLLGVSLKEEISTDGDN
ncbi:DUF3173 domain-containing protein [Sporolactobacillus putidus]|uniref:DUF3173 domain-containing protein n=1 Tax=Sporolactobacillus putidus TaxID=492735 RepID=A0A917S8Z8_9BACL|nr:DUF3173 domain-containing protein [Sporolactobacillus putidus]GGL63075.1 hypothetical protein GCM10007968_28750 [Sporolactobacillus putidus]